LSSADDVLSVGHEVGSLASIVVPVERYEVDGALATTGGEELRQPSRAHRWTAAGAVGNSR